MASAISSNNISLPATPDVEVLASLVRRLRGHVKAINNAAARQTVGKDMKSAADAIEHAIATLPQQHCAELSMVALLGRNGFAAYTGGR